MKKEEIIIFGATILGEIANLILCNDYEIIAYSDLNEEVWGAALNDIPIITPEQLIKKYKNTLIIIANPQHEQISKLLIKYGVKNIHIFNLQYSFDEVIKTTTINPIELLHHHNKDEFYRWDTIVRLLAIEQFYGKNDYGFNLYTKMQDYRVELGYGEKSLKKFGELIKSVEKNGFMNNSRIVVDKNLNLYDGSHRLALCIYHELDKIPIEILNEKKEIYYGRRWFEQVGFSKKEMDLVSQKITEIFEIKPLRFNAIIWSPVEREFKNIINDISRNFEIIENRSLKFNKENYRSFIKCIYKTDDIADWKVQKKFEYMCATEQEEFSVEYIEFLIERPNFRLKQQNLHSISQEVEALKSQIRNKYMGEVDKYFHDIIFHASDNLEQSIGVKSLIDGIQKIKLTDFFRRIHDNEYVLVKSDTPHMPNNFPQEIPLGKDLDLICSTKSYETIVSITEDFCEQFKSNFTIKKIANEKNVRFRIEFLSELVLQFDISCEIRYVNKIIKIDEKLLEYQLIDNVKIANSVLEFIIRGDSFLANNNKLHHKNYLKNNWDEIELAEIFNYLSDDETINLIREIN